jgi:hypothetical protein
MFTRPNVSEPFQIAATQTSQFQVKRTDVDESKSNAECGKAAL